MLKIVEFIRENENWEEILEGSPYSLRIKRKGRYILLTYTLGRTEFSFADFLLECRGVILDSGNNFNPVCVPFYKFFNYGEPNQAKLDWNSMRVEEKVDGSLIKIWRHEEEVKISTNGSIDAFDVRTPSDNIDFGNLFLTALREEGKTLDFFEDYLQDRNETIMFELTSLDNQILVEYGDIPQIRYLGSRNNDTLQEYTCNILKESFMTPKRHEFLTIEKNASAPKALKELMKDSLPWLIEGFVLVDNNYNRVKVKSENYVRAHYFIAGSSFKNHLDIIRNGELAEVTSYLSDAAKPIRELNRDLVKTTLKCFSDFFIILSETYGTDRREVAQFLNNNYFSGEVASLYFWWIDNSFPQDYNELYMKILSLSNRKIKNLMERYGIRSFSKTEN